MTTIYTIKDVLTNTKLNNNPILDEFLIACRDNLAEIEEPKNIKERKRVETRSILKTLKSSEKFCYNIGNKICISRIVLESVLQPESTKVPFNDPSIIKVIQNLTGYRFNLSDKKKYYNFISSSKSLATTFKQEFICYVINYFFNNAKSRIYDILFNLETGNIQDSDKLIIRSKVRDFRKMSHNHNFMYVADAYANAKTIYVNRSKLKLTKTLSEYTIAEETSANNLKENPFQRIKDTEFNYYTNADKLTTADMYIYDKNDKMYKTVMAVFNRSDKKLTHNQYRHFINHAFKNGVIIPISLKQLVTSSIDSTNDNFVTSRFKVVGSYKLEEGKSLEDDYMKSVIELFDTNSKQTFIRKINDMIDIEFDAADLGIDKQGMWIPFKTQFKKGKFKDNTLWFTSGQIHVQPKGSSSFSGLGGISRQYLFEKVILKLPRKAVFMSALLKSRKEVFSQYSSSSMIRSGKMLTQGEFKTLIADLLRNRTDEQVKQILFEYVNRLSRNMKSLGNLNFTGQYSRFTTISRQATNYAQKMSMFEMASFVVSHERIVHDWIKDSFVMSLYAAASAIGLIIFDGRHINLKNMDGKKRLKAMGNRLNPVYLKIGY
jgi:hypothetical protein